MNNDTFAAYATNGTLTALVLLARCLQSNGVLNAGQFEAALRNTIEWKDAPKDRPDYEFLANLLASLEGTHAKTN